MTQPESNDNKFEPEVFGSIAKIIKSYEDKTQAIIFRLDAHKTIDTNAFDVGITAFVTDLNKSTKTKNRWYKILSEDTQYIEYWIGLDTNLLKRLPRNFDFNNLIIARFAKMLGDTYLHIFENELQDDSNVVTKEKP